MCIVSYSEMFLIQGFQDSPRRIFQTGWKKGFQDKHVLGGISNRVVGKFKQGGANGNALQNLNFKEGGENSKRVGRPLKGSVENTGAGGP